MMTVRATGAGLWSFVVIKVSDNGTLVPKHVRVGTSHEVCLMVVFTVSYLVHFVA